MRASIPIAETAKGCQRRSTGLYVHQRARLTGDRGRCVQHLQKALTEMNVQLDNVLSDIMGKTGQLIVRAIVAGERDGAVLAGFRDPRVKADAAPSQRVCAATGAPSICSRWSRRWSVTTC